MIEHSCKERLIMQTWPLIFLIYVIFCFSSMSLSSFPIMSRQVWLRPEVEPASLSVWWLTNSTLTNNSTPLQSREGNCKRERERERERGRKRDITKCDYLHLLNVNWIVWEFRGSFSHLWHITLNIHSKKILYYLFRTWLPKGGWRLTISSNSRGFFSSSFANDVTPALTKVVLKARPDERERGSEREWEYHHTHSLTNFIKLLHNIFGIFP